MSDALAPARYFMKMYGSQHPFLNRANLSHTFASFHLRPRFLDGMVQPRDLTISWLPANGPIEPFGSPVIGRNFTLEETFTWLDEAESTDRWESDETEIQKELFDAAEDRVLQLGAGALRYKMIDRPRSRPNLVSNCIHAVSDLSIAIERLSMAVTGPFHGKRASRFVYQYFRPFYISPPRLSDELAE